MLLNVVQQISLCTYEMQVFLVKQLLYFSLYKYLCSAALLDRSMNLAVSVKREILIQLEYLKKCSRCRLNSYPWGMAKVFEKHM